MNYTLRLWPLATTLLLAAVLIGWFHGQPLALALTTLPLLTPLPGLLRGKRYTAAWACMLSLFYMGLGLTEAVADPVERPWAYATAFAGMAMFLACIAFVRQTPRDS